MLSWLGPLAAGEPCELPDNHAKNPPKKSIATIKMKPTMLNNAQYVPRYAFAVSSRTLMSWPSMCTICFAITAERFSNAQYFIGKGYATFDLLSK
jgi:hypothetical protein